MVNVCLYVQCHQRVLSGLASVQVTVLEDKCVPKVTFVLRGLVLFHVTLIRDSQIVHVFVHQQQYQWEQLQLQLQHPHQ